jgi:hypothetical protein
MDPDIMITLVFGLGVVAFALLAGIVLATHVLRSRKDNADDDSRSSSSL